MSGFLLVHVKQINKATVINWNSLKTRSYDFFAPYTFSVTHEIMLARQGGKCVFQLMRLTKC